MRKVMTSFNHAWNGLVTAWMEELNFRIELVFSLIILIVTIAFGFSAERIAFIGFVLALVLVAELVNTAFEDLSDKVEPNYDPIIKRVKDLGATFTSVASVAALIVIALVFYQHFSGN